MSIEPVLKLSVCQILMVCATDPALMVQLLGIRLYSAVSQFQLDRDSIKKDDQSPNRFDMMSNRKNREEKPVTSSERQPGKHAWFSHDRLGMFIHWGLYALGARHEWLKNPES
ncbi:UNVERIFIED_ORG: hypothetical protein GGE64_002532 [Rhizobium etli]